MKSKSQDLIPNPQSPIPNPQSPIPNPQSPIPNPLLTMRRIPYTSEIFAEDQQVVALCPELNVSSFADTPEQALESLKEAVAAFLEECQRMGTLEIVLEEAGLKT